MALFAHLVVASLFISCFTGVKSQFFERNIVPRSRCGQYLVFSNEGNVVGGLRLRGGLVFLSAVQQPRHYEIVIERRESAPRFNFDGSVQTLPSEDSSQPGFPFSTSEAYSHSELPLALLSRMRESLIQRLAQSYTDASSDTPAETGEALKGRGLIGTVESVQSMEIPSNGKDVTGEAIQSGGGEAMSEMNSVRDGNDDWRPYVTSDISAETGETLEGQVQIGADESVQSTAVPSDNKDVIGEGIQNDGDGIMTEMRAVRSGNDDLMGTIEAMLQGDGLTTEEAQSVSFGDPESDASLVASTDGDSSFLDGIEWTTSNILVAVLVAVAAANLVVMMLLSLASLIYGCPEEEPESTVLVVTPDQTTPLLKTYEVLYDNREKACSEGMEPDTSVVQYRPPSA